MKEKFIDYRPSQKVKETLDNVTLILDSYEAQGYDLTLRQLYYQLVARDLFPDDRKWRWTGSKWVRDPKGTINAQPNYDWLGEIVSKARKAGMIDWEMIKDRNRETVSNTHWKNPAQIVSAAASQFQIDKWADQPCHVEVMVEKDALSGVLGPVCRSLDVMFTANKGYPSSSILYEVGKRIETLINKDKEVYILYFGDHDPSGIDMTRDVWERVEMYSWARIDVKRLALNMEQIEILNPPENPAKMTDSRAKAYIRQYGESSWELDAVEPSQLAALVENAVVSLRDEDLWDQAVERERGMKEELQDFVRRYNQR